MAMCLETKHMRDATKPPYWFKHLQSAMNGKIRCQSNPAVTKGKDFTITHTLFDNDTAIIVNSCKELIERGITSGNLDYSCTWVNATKKETGCHLNQKPCSSPRKTQPTENLIRKLSPT
jgi:hypothetical protein